MRVVIAGGGTGGHLFPGIAVAEEIKARDPGAEVLFVGTARGIEARVCPKLGWPLELIEVSGLKTVGALGALRGLARLPRAIWQSRRILRRFRPDVVVGVGGYASGPVLLAARLGGRRTAVLEQNSVPGLTNKWLGKMADAVFIAFEESRRFFPAKKIHAAGNPIRRALRERLVAAGDTAAAIGAAEAGRVPHVFCFGGSQGAKAVNAVFADAVGELGRRGVAVTVTHQTGKDDLEPTRARYEKGQEFRGESGRVEDRPQVLEFIDDMAAEYARADLIVARAGATTIAEVTAVGRPAILIPYPHAADDHQTVNARSLAEAGAALVFKQSELTAEQLADAMAGLLGDRQRLAQMAQAMRSLGRPDAAARVVDWLERPGRS